MSAATELLERLEPGETVEAVCFGQWGGDSEYRAPRDGEEWKPEWDEPVPVPVPFDKRGIVLSWEEAKPLMEGWKFGGGFGTPETYATFIWTNRRVLYVAQYDGSTWLESAPRNPTPCLPTMPGGS